MFGNLTDCVSSCTGQLEGNTFSFLKMNGKLQGEFFFWPDFILGLLYVAWKLCIQYNIVCVTYLYSSVPGVQNTVWVVV